MKMLVKIFVDPDHLVRVINLLTELGMTGFYLIEYQGMAPHTWKDFRLSENPELAMKAIRDQAEPGVMVNMVIASEKYCRIVDGLEEALRGKRYTIIGHEIVSVKVKGD